MRLTCPACGQEARRVQAAFGDQSAAYCGNCGWNAALAAQKLRSVLATQWFVAIFGILLSVFVWYRSSLGSGLAVGSAFVLFPLSFGLLTLVRVRRLERVGSQFRNAGAGIRAIEPVLGVSVPQEVLRYERRPRKARLNWRGWMFSAGVFALGVLLIQIARLILRDEPQALKSGQALFALVVFSFYLGLCVSFFVKRWQEFRLLIEGSFARGEVLAQQDVSRS